MGSGVVSEPISIGHGLEQDPEPMHSLWVYTNALARITVGAASMQGAWVWVRTPSITYLVKAASLDFFFHL